MIRALVTVLCWSIGTVLLGHSLAGGPVWLLPLAAMVLGFSVVARPKKKPPPVVDASHRDLEQDHMLARLEQRYAAMPDPDWAEMEREAWAVVTGEAVFEENFRRKLDREVQKKRLTVEEGRYMRQMARTEKEKLLRIWSR